MTILESGTRSLSTTSILVSLTVSFFVISALVWLCLLLFTDLTVFSYHKIFLFNVRNCYLLSCIEAVWPNALADDDDAVLFALTHTYLSRYRDW